MAVIIRTIADTLDARVAAAFNARFRGRDETSTNLQIINAAVDNFIRGVVADYEAGNAANAADTTARTDIVII